MRYIAALMASNGTFVTGHHHGEAFGKLNDEEQNQEIRSGFLDPITGKFFGDDFECYVRKIMMIRHGEYHRDNSVDPGMNQNGFNQIRRTAQHLVTSDLSSYQAYTSPYLRCLQTAQILSCICKIKFIVEPLIGEEVDADCVIPARQQEFSEFKWPDKEEFAFTKETSETFSTRINGLLENLPPKSILICHCPVIYKISQLSLEQEDIDPHIPHGSLTFIEDHKVVWLG